MAIAKQVILTERSEPVSEVEWIDLSQDLNTIPSRGIDAKISESNQEQSREQSHPEAPIEDANMFASETALQVVLP